MKFVEPIRKSFEIIEPKSIRIDVALMKNDMSFKKIESTLTQNRANKAIVEHASALLELKMKEVYEKGFKDGQGSSDVNPYKIKIEEQFADPDDPKIGSIEEKKNTGLNHKGSVEKKKNDTVFEIVNISDFDTEIHGMLNEITIHSRF